MKLPRIFPPVYFLAHLGLALALRRFLPTPISLPELHLQAGRGLLWIGVAIALSAMVSFRRHRTTVIPFSRSEALIQTGPFRWSRNPIYLGEAVILAGACVKFGHILPWLVLPVFVIGVNRFIIKWEEAALLARFGDVYSTYCQQTRRWL